MSMEFNSENLLEELGTYFEDQAKALSGQQPSRWFNRADLEEDIKNELATTDLSVYGSYLLSFDAETRDPTDVTIADRAQLGLLAGLLSGFRHRYVAGEDSRPRSELDTRRYAMYSSRARKIMLNRIKDKFKEMEEQ
jgi:hypothetical protein